MSDHTKFFTLAERELRAATLKIADRYLLAEHRCPEGNEDFFARGGTILQFSLNRGLGRRWEMNFGLLKLEFDIVACPFCGEELPGRDQLLVSAEAYEEEALATQNSVIEPPEFPKAPEGWPGERITEGE